jgi:thiol:disulfide interchange protein DsbD
VLPVIALKILGFVNQAKDTPGHVHKLGLLYAAGVLVSFLALAALVIGVKAAGRQAGWGMQFSNPQFVIVFTILVTLVALNLFGVFEVTLSGRVMGAAGNLASRHGASGAFFNGVLATALATPCTAPFLSLALGFAFAQTAPVIVLVFLTVGAGLAAPYVALSWYPAWLKFLPKPGVWMEKFKIAMGFPMLGTAVWLSKVGPEYYGERAWWLGVFLVLLAVAAWIFGEFVQRGRTRKPLAVAGALALLLLGYAWALESQLDWRSPVNPSSQANAPLKYAPKGYTWERWSPAAVQAARDAGRVIVVDFTAWWCGTCNVTVKPALSDPEVVEKLKDLKAVALLADNSDTPPEIVSELARYGRAGVPMVLVYPAGHDAIVVPDPLSPFPGQYVPVILEALNKAAK